jgi:hypothetical protein
MGTSLLELQADTLGHVISPEDIKTLTGRRYENPVISLYLQFNAQKVTPQGKALLRVFHSMKHEALKQRRDWIDTLEKQQKKRLRNDLEEVEAFLLAHTSPKEVHSVIVFKSGSELNRVVMLPVRMIEILTIDVDPYVMPLDIALEENERVLFVEFSLNECRLFLYHLGYCQEIDRITTSLPAAPIEGDTTDGASRRLAHAEWHLKKTAQHVYALYNARSCQALILMGEARSAHFLESYLHQTLREKIISRIYSTPAANQRSRKELIENALHELKSAREDETMKEISGYRPGTELICGLRDVVRACNLFLIRKLFAAQGVPARGFLCKEHHYLSFAKEECPFCHRTLSSVSSVLDEVIEIARLRGLGITMFENRPDLLAAYEGVAAVLYPGTKVV